MKLIRLSLFVMLCSLCSFAQPVRNHALATHHTIKGSTGFKKLAHSVKGDTVGVVKGIGHDVKAISVGTFVTAYDTAEAGVDTVGVGLQGIADGVDMGIAAPLESLPKPLNEIGVAIHGLYLGIDAVGQFLAK